MSTHCSIIVPTDETECGHTAVYVQFDGMPDHMVEALISGVFKYGHTMVVEFLAAKATTGGFRFIEPDGNILNSESYDDEEDEHDTRLMPTEGSYVYDLRNPDELVVHGLYEDPPQTHFDLVEMRKIYAEMGVLGLLNP